MSVSAELKKIKKTYGEEFMHFCRSNFPTILETEGKLYKILTTYFDESCKTLYEDLKEQDFVEDFRGFIINKAKRQEETEEVKVEKTPYELLDEAGYTLYECQTEEEIQRFKKYYAPGEELCTFRGNRLNDCVVFFAVKKNAQDLKREDFKSPRRQDEYGTSVISIQFKRNGKCTCSIKNRYNHTVSNPDATFGNNLDRIIPGLTYSFNKLLQERGLTLDISNVQDLDVSNYIRADNGKYYRYNTIVGDKYFCSGNNMILNGKVSKAGNPEQQILIDNYIVDLENKTITDASRDEKLERLGEGIFTNNPFANNPSLSTFLGDPFLDSFKDIKRIVVEKDKEKGNGARKIVVYHESQEMPSTIEINKNNQITGFESYKITNLDKDFLTKSKALKSLRLPNLRTLKTNLTSLGNIKLDFPNLEEIGNNAFTMSNIEEISFPRVKRIGRDFGASSRLKRVSLPMLEQVGNGFLVNCMALEYVNIKSRNCSTNNF